MLNNTIFRRITDVLFYLCMLILVVALNFSDTPPGWFQQFPPIGSRSVTDIQFLDSLTGWAVTDDGASNDTCFIIKTTDGGSNWTRVYYRTPNTEMYTVTMINAQTGFVTGAENGPGFVLKTIDGGGNWINIFPGGNPPLIDAAFLSGDIGWVCSDAGGGFGGVWHTTNSGNNWLREATVDVNNLFFINSSTGWFSRTGGSNQLYKTTNSGVNWNLQFGFASPLGDVFFVDENTGWITGGNAPIMKTTDGGNSWSAQTEPTGQLTGKFHFLNNTTGWLGNYIQKIDVTTNGGVSWGIQTTPNFTNFSIYFIDSLKGWGGYAGIIHTTDGGGQIIYNGVTHISSEIPSEFRLYQNYPNPFNPVTNIKYSIKPNVKGQMSKVSLKIYDIGGKQITELVHQKQSAGTYLADWNASGYASGVYFYSLIVDGSIIDTKKMLLVK